MSERVWCQYITHDVMLLYNILHNIAYCQYITHDVMLIKNILHIIAYCQLNTLYMSSRESNTEHDSIRRPTNDWTHYWSINNSSWTTPHTTSSLSIISVLIPHYCTTYIYNTLHIQYVSSAIELLAIGQTFKLCQVASSMLFWQHKENRDTYNLKLS